MALIIINLSYLAISAFGFICHKNIMAHWDVFLLEFPNVKAFSLTLKNLILKIVQKIKTEHCPECPQ